MLINQASGGVSEREYPDVWQQDSVRLPLTYRFEPGVDTDGVTVHIPLAVLNQVTGDGFAWHVPGLRQDIVTALIRSLPKPLRRHFVPVPDFAKAVLERLGPGEEPLLDAVERELRSLTSVAVPREAWQVDQIPDHLKTTFRVVDEDNHTLAEGKDLRALKQRLKAQVRASMSAAADGIERGGLSSWTCGTLPRTHQQNRAGFVVTAYPALVDEGDNVAIRLFDTEAEQRAAMWQGTRRLLLMNLPSPLKVLQRNLNNEAKLTLSRNPHGSVADLLADCIACAADKLIAEGGGPAWTEDGFAGLRDSLRAELGDTVFDVVTHVQRILTAWQGVENQLTSMAGPMLEPAVADVRTQLSALVYPGFVTVTGWRRLPDVLRYLHAIQRRLERLPERLDRDREWMRTIEHVQEAYQQLLDKLPPDEPPGEALLEVRWMIEELRVSHFAQALGTPYSVSDKRIFRAMDELTP
jgi:ATP-dependent helicase HrpA